MSNRRLLKTIQPNIALFAALGDQTRVSLLVKLVDGNHWSITQLTDGSSVSRQAVTKHLGVLQEVGLVSKTRFGREQLFCMKPEPLTRAKSALEAISKQWDNALARLSNFLDEEE